MSPGIGPMMPEGAGVEQGPLAEYMWTDWRFSGDAFAGQPMTVESVTLDFLVKGWSPLGGSYWHVPLDLQAPGHYLLASRVGSIGAARSAAMNATTPWVSFLAGAFGQPSGAPPAVSLLVDQATYERGRIGLIPLQAPIRPPSPGPNIGRMPSRPVAGPAPLTGGGHGPVVGEGAQIGIGESEALFLSQIAGELMDGMVAAESTPAPDLQFGPMQRRFLAANAWNGGQIAVLVVVPDGARGVVFSDLRLDLAPRDQEGWKWCGKCQGLTFARGRGMGACWAGGAHDHNGSSYYAVNQDPTGSWRWCNKCQSLIADVDGAPCPGGQQHDHDGSGAYLVATGPLGPISQAGWRSCSRCGLLAYTGFGAGPCAGGATHDQSSSADFSLRKW